jgi:hypothetical protein
MNETATVQPSGQIPSNPSWFFMGGGSAAVATAPSAPSTPAAADDLALAAQIHAKANSNQAVYGNLRTLRPSSASQPAVQATNIAMATVPQPLATEVTAPSHPAILALANNDDLNVSTIAREAKKAKGNESGDGEVVISLH